MGDTKLSALTELAATPATDDEVYIRDVSEVAADESKRITVANLIAGAGGGNSGVGFISIPSYNHDSIGQGTWAVSVGRSDSIGNYVFLNSSSSDGDNLSYKVYLQAGTYTLRFLYKQTGGSAIVDIDIDGVEVASVDTYHAAGSANQFKTETGSVIATSGIKTLKIRADGKHASSSGYNVYKQALALWRTA